MGLVSPRYKKTKRSRTGFLYFVCLNREPASTGIHASVIRLSRTVLSEFFGLSRTAHGPISIATATGISAFRRCEKETYHEAPQQDCASRRPVGGDRVGRFRP